MDRLDNLKTSLQSWVGIPLIGDIVVVDWSSKSPLHDDPYLKNLARSGRIKIVRVEGERYFSLPKSYNLAFSHTDPRNRILLKLDADYRLVDKRWLEPIRNQVLGLEGISNMGRLYDYFIVGSHTFSLNYTGFILVNKDNFVFYNENIEGYGQDDVEMYARIKKKFPELTEIPFFNIKDYIFHIPHTDEDRSVNYENKDIHKTSLKNMKVSPEFKLSSYRTLSESRGLVTVERVPD